MSRIFVTTEKSVSNLETLYTLLEPPSAFSTPTGYRYDIGDGAFLRYLIIGDHPYYDGCLRYYEMSFHRWAKVLRLNTVKKYMRFVELYALGKDSYFKWDKLAQKCDAIEFSFNFSDAYDFIARKYGLSHGARALGLPERNLISLLVAPTGYIWNKRAIKSLDLIKHFHSHRSKPQY